MQKDKMKIGVIGLGYVGFPLACTIAKNKSYKVFGFDLSKEKIDLINQKKSPIEDKQAEKDIKTVKITASTDPEILKDSDIFIVCVPTPVFNDHTPDLDPIKNATKTISKYLKNGSLVIIESTINPGVCEEVIIPILETETKLKSGKDFDLAHCPERINPGDPKWNVYNIPRNIGATTPQACKKAANFYRSFINAEINEMSSLKTAEATKIIENTFRDINIAYVNELAKSFDILGIDLTEVIRGASNKPFAFMPHFPSCGVGGHCIPVDPYYLIERAKKSGFDHKFVRIAREINNSMPQYTVDLLTDALNSIGKPIKNTRIGILGISFKANISDKRESPALTIIKLLQKKGANLSIFDPYCLKDSTGNSLEELLQNVDAVLIATDHKEFKKLTPLDFQKHNIKVVIDGKNIYDKQAFLGTDIIYKGIGRG
jgi:nucleotide sugar dehydrogenase